MSGLSETGSIDGRHIQRRPSPFDCAAIWPVAEARNCEVERPLLAACAMILIDLEAVEAPLGIAALV